jgi:YHS domain-containing protein
MFVNVEIPISLPEMIAVPSEAVLDSGLKKTVFVDRGNGWFEPRQVETGRSLGDRVEILRGLTRGEKIVVSGNFLIDSESRLKQASAGIFGKPGRDPVCGMALDEDRAKAAGLTRQYGGKSFYFCSPEDMAKFDKAPQKYANSTGAVEPMTMPHGSGTMPMTHGDGKMTMPAMKGTSKSATGDGGMPMEWGYDGKPVVPGIKGSSRSGTDNGATPTEMRHDGMIRMPGASGPSRFGMGIREKQVTTGNEQDMTAPKVPSPPGPGSTPSEKPMKRDGGASNVPAEPVPEPETSATPPQESSGDPLEAMKSLIRPRNDK